MPTAGGALLLATCIATPYVFVYDLTLASPAALYAWTKWRQGPWAHRGMEWPDLLEAAVWALLWTLPLVAFVLNRRGVPVGPWSLQDVLQRRGQEPDRV